MTIRETNTQALVLHAPQPLEPWKTPEWQRLWLSLLRRPWSVLALVPASGGAPADFTTRIGVALARVGTIHLGAPVHLGDATDLDLRNMRPFLEDIAHCRAVGDRILLALAPIRENPVTETLIQSADCALLCLLFEEMASAEASRTVNTIGKERFVGSTIFRAEGAPAK
jgi:hypothetical protein